MVYSGKGTCIKAKELGLLYGTEIMFINVPQTGKICIKVMNFSCCREM